MPPHERDKMTLRDTRQLLPGEETVTALSPVGTQRKMSDAAGYVATRGMLHEEGAASCCSIKPWHTRDAPQRTRRCCMFYGKSACRAPPFVPRTELKNQPPFSRERGE